MALVPLSRPEERVTWGAKQLAVKVRVGEGKERDTREVAG